MKLCGAGDCGCYVSGGNERVQIRGSGGAGVPMRINWLLYPRAAEVSMSAQGTRYWVDGSSVKLFNRLPFRITRNSLRGTNVASQLTYAMGDSTPPSGETAPPRSYFTTDPEFTQYFDADLAEEGIVGMTSEYDSYEVTLEVLYVNQQNYDGFKWTNDERTAILHDPYTSRHLEVLAQSASGTSGVPAARVPLHGFRAYKPALHAPKVPLVRLAFHGTHGHSWSFTVVNRSLVTETGGFDPDASPSKAKVGVYGLLSVYG